MQSPGAYQLQYVQVVYNGKPLYLKNLLLYCDFKEKICFRNYYYGCKIIEKNVYLIKLYTLLKTGKTLTNVNKMDLSCTLILALRNMEQQSIDSN